MKLLFDQNLSFRLPVMLRDVYQESIHVRDVGLGSADDSVVWNYARDNGFAIVSKDEDFHQRSFVHGAPPKIIWLRVGNCPTGQLFDLLNANVDALEAFDSDQLASFLVLR